MNDLMAAGVYDYAVKHNLTIGKDLSVIGFDNREICAAFTPALSTMALPLRKMGTIAADYLIQKSNILNHLIRMNIKYHVKS